MSFRPCFALLLLPVLASRALAQPPTAPSSINQNPTNWNFGGRVPPPVRLDPPQITPDELQTLTGGPTLVTFSGTDVPIGDAVKVLLEAAHLPLSDFGGQFGKKTLNVDWQKAPFWKAAAEVEAASGSYWNSRFDNTLSLADFGGG